ncbi:hypothetical protein QF030_002688 [Streptomyces rishiriensis]|uniref:Uncharacterized protein n=1 Tax=Streptomyces rishiriensis TaxID=68264 RepID=A0ABU0NPR4_STRRH|nr:hypothetical protein [Streptomyces rishiriensis]
MPRRRLDFVGTPTGFRRAEGNPVPAEEAKDLFRQGMPWGAGATGEAERARPRGAIERLTQASRAFR